MTDNPFVLGLDIGYGNLKVAFGHVSGGMQTAIRPVGAAPASSLSPEMGGAQVDGVRVTVGGDPWVAGVDRKRR